MFTLREQPADFYNSNKALRKVLSELTAVVPVQRVAVTLPRNHVIPNDKIYEGKLYLLKEGFLRCKRGDTLLLFFEPGDLVGLAGLDGDTLIYADSDVVVDEYSKKTFFSTIRRDPTLFILWTKFISYQYSLYISLINDDDEDSRPPRAGRSRLDQDSSALADGVDDGLDGEADVFVGATRMGKVLSREVFKAMVTMAGEGRAPISLDNVDNVIVQIPKSHFLALIKAHPNAVLKMLENMARLLAARYP